MARTPDRPAQRSIREQLTEVSAFVTEAGRADLAQAVDAVLTPGGWEQLRATDTVYEGVRANLAFAVPASLRKQIEEAVEADPNAASMSAKVTEGFTKFLAGEFSLMDRTLARPTTVENWVNLNIRTWKALTQQVTEKVRRDVTNDRRAGAGRVASEYLMFCYQLGPYAPEERQERLARGAQRNLPMPRRIRDQITAAAAGSGDRVSDVVNEGFAKFLDGRFDAEPVVWAEADLADMTVLKAHPSDELFEQVKQKCKAHPVLNAKTGMNQVAVAYLLDEFGLTPAE